MANLTLPVAGIRRQIRQLLTDKYPLETVFREIAQNADDARASRLDLVIVGNGLQGAQNSLLHTPGLVCINNGPFRRRHAAAVCRLSETSKATDASSIGRFGLGMKSVFHLAEGFLFLGRSRDSDEIFGEAIDLWSDSGGGDPVHPDWDSFRPEDRARVQSTRSLLHP